MLKHAEIVTKINNAKKEYVAHFFVSAFQIVNTCVICPRQTVILLAGMVLGHQKSPNAPVKINAFQMETVRKINGFCLHAKIKIQTPNNFLKAIVFIFPLL